MADNCDDTLFGGPFVIQDGTTDFGQCDDSLFGGPFVIYASLATNSYADGASSSGLVFGGEVVEVGTIISSYDDGTPSSGLVFAGSVTEVGKLLNNQSDGTSSGSLIIAGASAATFEAPTNNQTDAIGEGGICFGGAVTETWIPEPNDLVAVKGGTYRIDGETYTLSNTMSYPGLGDIAALVNCSAAPATANYMRYDLLSIDDAGAITVTHGTSAVAPVMPSTPSDAVKLNHVLRYYGQTAIIQSDIGKMFTARTITTITVAAADSELAWGELTTTLTVTLKDQYGMAYLTSATVIPSFLIGNGTFTPSSRSTSTGSTTFTYTRGGADPGDQSPIIQMAVGSVMAICSIILLDASGDPMT